MAHIDWITNWLTDKSQNISERQQDLQTATPWGANTGHAAPQFMELNKLQQFSGVLP